MRTPSTLVLLAGALAVGGCGVGSGTGIDANPIVDITAPLDGDTVHTNVNISATVLDDFGVDKVEFMVDGTLLPGGLEFDPPFSINWNTLTVTNNATHAISVKATDRSGNFGLQQIHVVVQRGSQ